MAPENILLVILFLGLTAYALLAGADFGAGLWEVNTALQNTPQERKLLFSAIGPVWEANHVWLIFILVALFGAFPTAFAAVCQALWLPLVLALTGIVFRGVGFAFRSYSVGQIRLQFLWEIVFALGSTAAPFFLGACVGALASGQLKVLSDGDFDGNFVSGWLSPMALFTGFFVVGMCSFLSAVYLAREASTQPDRELLLRWRARGMASGMWMGVLALAGLAYVATDAPLLWEGFRARSWPLVAVSLAGGFLALISLAREWYRLAVVSAATAVTSVIWGWAVAQYPMLVPPSITIENAKAPDNILWLLVATIGIGSLLLLPALAYLFYIFKTEHRQATPGK